MVIWKAPAHNPVGGGGGGGGVVGLLGFHLRVMRKQTLIWTVVRNKESDRNVERTLCNLLRLHITDTQG